MEEIRQAEESGISVRGQCVKNISFTDDVDLLNKDRDSLQSDLVDVSRPGESVGLKANVGKTRTMVYGQQDSQHRLQRGQVEVENVREFVCLGSMVTWDNDCTKDTKNRIAKPLQSWLNRERQGMERKSTWRTETKLALLIA